MTDERGPGPDYAPYTAPAGEQQRAFAAAATASVSAPGYREHRLTMWLACGTLSIQALSQIVAGAWGLNHVFGWTSLEQTPLVRRIVVALHASHVYIFGLGVVGFALFLLNANRNARAFFAAEFDTASSEEVEDDDEIDYSLALRPRLLQFSPASMAWWFFVPIFNFFRPFQAVKAVWLASTPKGAAKETQDSTLPLAWWLAWLAYWLSAMLVSPKRRPVWLSQRGYDLSFVASAGVRLIACFFALQMVRALYERQRTRAAELWPQN